MKLRNHLIIALSSLIATNCFAFEIYKGKLLEHKEWTTGNAEGSYIHNPNLPTLIKNKESSNLEVANFEILATKGTAGTPTIIKGNNYFWYENGTGKTQEYTYTLSTCASMTEKTENCIHISDKFSLEPNGVFRQNISPELKVIFDKPGSYKTFSGGYLSRDYESQIQNGAASTAEIS